MFSKQNIQNIPIEQTPHNSGSRKVLATKDEVESKNFEAFTYGFLQPKEKWAMHKHEDIVEICLVVKGSGVIRDITGEEENFESGDRFIFPSDTEHEIENSSDDTAEFYFFRIKND